jgi:HEAT repeat protein
MKKFDRYLIVMVTICLSILSTSCKDRDDYIVDITGKEPSNKVRAAQALSKYDDPFTVKALLIALNDSDKEVRAEAVTSLATIFQRNQGKDPSQEALEPLSKLVRYDADNKVRFAAVDALGALADERAVDELIKIVDFRVTDIRILRAEGAKLLGQKKIKRAESALIGALLEDPDTDVRRAAAWALGEAGGPEAVKALEIIAQDPHFKNVHGYANDALKKLGSPPASP